jgi:hypothetical protein
MKSIMGSILVALLAAAPGLHAQTVSGSFSGGTVGIAAGDFPHLPPGYSKITERGWSATDEDGWSHNVSGDYTLTTDSSAPVSPPDVGQCLYPAGYSGGSSPCYTWRGTSSLSYTKLYVAFRVKLSSNWQPHSSNINKIGYIWIHTTSTPSVYPVYYGSAFPLTPRIGLQNIPTGSIYLAQNVPPYNTTPKTIVNDGAWHTWEISLVSNTVTPSVLPDGTCRWWIDGVLVGSYSAAGGNGIEFSDSGTYAGTVWNQVGWQPVWGGSGDTVTADMEMWMDDYAAYGAP